MKIDFRPSEIDGLVNLAKDDLEQVSKYHKTQQYLAAATAARNLASWANTLAVILSEYNRQD